MQKSKTTPGEKVSELTVEQELEIRKAQIGIMASALHRISEAVNFEGAKMSASIAIIGANFEHMKRQQLGLDVEEPDHIAGKPT